MDFQSAMETFAEAWAAANAVTQVSRQSFLNPNWASIPNPHGRTNPRSPTFEISLIQKLTLEYSSASGGDEDCERIRRNAVLNLKINIISD